MASFGHRHEAALTFRSVPVGELRPDELAAWRRLADASPKFANPFLTPGYSLLVARCGQDVRAGLMVLEGEIVGVFPHEMEGVGRARPVGSIFCDYQAVIVAPGIRWTPDRLLRGLGLEEWRFDHVLRDQSEWAPHHERLDVSWAVDLSSGFGAYAAWMREAGRGQLAEAARKARKLSREVGELSFEPHVVDHDLLDRLLAWKSTQWAASGWPGRFKAEWEQRLMHGLLETADHEFSGLFSVLRAGGQPLAMHIGMRSKRVWHYWTTAYDPAFRRYSPGILMLVEMLRCATALGVSEFDMGKESFEYKRRLHTHVVPLAEGTARIGAI